MPDIKEAIKKMVVVCRGTVVIIWPADVPQCELLYTMIWPSLYGKAYKPSPKSDILFKVLYQMGIYPSVENFEIKQKQVFTSLEDLKRYFSYQHNLECNPDNPVMKWYLDTYVESGNGLYIHYERLPGMVFQWSVQDNNDEGIRWNR